jgi:hypothetical protein
MKDELVYVCEICQTPLWDEHHCKAICRNCGRTFDCSDLPIMQANLRVTDEGAVTTPGTDPRDSMPKMVDGGENFDEGADDPEKASVADLP